MLPFAEKKTVTTGKGYGVKKKLCVYYLVIKNLCIVFIAGNKMYHDWYVGAHVSIRSFYGHSSGYLIQPGILCYVFSTAFVNTVTLIDHFERSCHPAASIGSLLSGFWQILNLMLSLVIWINSKPDKMSSTCKAMAIKDIWKINSLFMSMPQTWGVLICHLSLHLSVNSQLNWLLMRIRWIILETRNKNKIEINFIINFFDSYKNVTSLYFKII